MHKKHIIIMGLCLAIVSFAYMSIRGRTYTFTADVPVSLTDIESIVISMESSEKTRTSLQVTFCVLSKKHSAQGRCASGSGLLVRARSMSKGK